LRERGDEDALGLELLRALTEPPRVECDLPDVVSAGEETDLVDAVEDAAVAVIDRTANV
jgi:hypothetical protein